jgi:hypothetical protein
MSTSLSPFEDYLIHGAPPDRTAEIRAEKMKLLRDYLLKLDDFLRWPADPNKWLRKDDYPHTRQELQIRHLAGGKVEVTATTPAAKRYLELQRNKFRTNWFTIVLGTIEGLIAPAFAYRDFEDEARELGADVREHLLRFPLKNTALYDAMMAEKRKLIKQVDDLIIRVIDRLRFDLETLESEDSGNLAD